MAASWVLPAVWIGFLALIFGLFARINRDRNTKKLLQIAEEGGYFGPHLTKIQYEELAECFSPNDPEGRKLLSAALVSRTITDVKNIWRIREEKPAMQNLVKQGAIGEELWENLVAAEEEIEREIMDVTMCAELYKKGWKDTIFPQISQMLSQMQAEEAHQEAARIAAEQQKQTTESTDTTPIKDITEDGMRSETSESAHVPDSENGETDVERRARLVEELLREEDEEKKKSAKKSSKKGKKKK